MPISIFTHLYVLSWAFSILLALLLNSYHGLIFGGAQNAIKDGLPFYCNLGLQLGQHCFTDYSGAIVPSLKENPFAEGVPYPPLTFTIFKLIGMVGNFTSHTATGFIYQIFLLLALVIPVWHLRFRLKKISSNTFWLLLPVSITTSAGLFTFDRGSNVAILAPLIYFCFLGWQNRSLPMIVITVLIMGHIKPQFAILLIFILILWGIRKFVVWTTVYLVSFAASFLLYPSHVFEAIKLYIHNLINYSGQDFLFSNVVYANISLANFFSFYIHLFGFNISPKLLVTSASLLIALLVIAIIYRFKKIDNAYVFLILIIIPIIGPSATWRYYFVALLPFFQIIMAGLIEENFKSSYLFLFVTKYFFQSKLAFCLSTIVFIGSMVPFAFSLSHFGRLTTGLKLYWDNTPFIFSASHALIFLFFYFVYKAFKPLSEIDNLT